MRWFQISIHALREEGDPTPFRAWRPETPISIHALREEGDCPSGLWRWQGSYFYPRPPRGGRLALDRLAKRFEQFLSTPSARRATCVPDVRPGGRGDFYPRPPRGGRLVKVYPDTRGNFISIHALREEGDETDDLNDAIGILFLSTPSARRATHRHILSGGTSNKFLSTPSARRATPAAVAAAALHWDFYPRPPRGGRPQRARTGAPHQPISIHALREEGDLKS